MKQTVAKYFCDRCGSELEYEPPQRMSLPQDICGAAYRYRLDVYVTYASNDVAANESHLCTDCKLYALDEAKKMLKDARAEEQQKGAQQ